ncbi:MAG: leucine--tRNA ligase [Crocinitomicaceae bacterium]|nr:leucine--tRNA ligase [Crocinitomicaceae bacterium]
MEYDFREIEAKWQKYWAEHKTYAAKDDTTLPKYYGLSMFPYPSGAGLHVGHPLGYIASCIYARYKKLQGYNVLHPMGYDSFGLPAEQYAIQTGQHPALTTAQNIKRYREQLDKIGFSFDWDREVRTSDPSYYKWTQWIFKQLFNSWYNSDSDKAESIDALVKIFETRGNGSVNAPNDQTEVFTADQWKTFSEAEQQKILMNYRLTFLADSWVNWCPALGTVLANDEIKDGVSERGGHPVEQKLMRQWSMRITAYAERLINDLETVDWSDSIKEQQRNWIGKSEGASVHFKLADHEGSIEVFTTRPDTIFGVSFMVLAPEHELVDQITTGEFSSAVAEYKKQASLKTERDRQSDVKNVTGQNTGAFAIHPFTGEKVQIWIADYVLAGYGTGAVMAVPCGDQRDWDFATHFKIEIKNIFKDVDISEAAYAEKDAVITDSDFLNGLECKVAIKKAIEEIEKKGFGKGRTNYRLRDAVFSRQRYWGEPFPVYYKNDIPYLIEDKDLPIELPEVDQYLPTADGEPPLARASAADWEKANPGKIKGDHMEYNTMPGWAGSSWYFLRYMDPHNEEAFVSKEKAAYWNQVDLYIGGSEHATGHLLYSRFWTKFLYDMGYITFHEPFKKMINQGMILGRSSIMARLEIGSEKNEIFISHNILEEIGRSPELIDNKEQIFEHIRNLISEENYQKILEGISFGLVWSNLRIDINYVENDKLNFSLASKDPKYNNLGKAEIITELNGDFVCDHEVEKMSKSKYNVQTPDELVEKFGADTLRCYEMFLGPLEQAKPWDTQGINGVHNFLRKMWRLFHDENNNLSISDGDADKQSLKTLHKTIKKVTDDLGRFSLNTAVSNFMIAVNELTDQKCNNRNILKELVVLVSPYAPHIAEELWSRLGEKESVTTATWPTFDASYLVEAEYAYPVSFNGKMRFKIELPTSLSKEDVEKEVLAAEQSQKWLEGKDPKKVIVVPGKIVNIVI